MRSPLMRHFPWLILVLAIGSTTGCLMPPSARQHGNEDERFFLEAQKALDSRDYVDAIEKFSLFLQQFPKSPKYSWALQRLGESYEGLLDADWQRRIERGDNRDLVTREFLNRYGKYGVWVEQNGKLFYDKRHYRMIVEKFPDSPIADEAQYRLIVLSDNSDQDPTTIASDLAKLEEILEKYPTTSLRPEILYHIAHRCRMLYEIFSFSPSPQMRNPNMAEQYRTKAVYAYKLCLQSPEHSSFSQKAWEELREIEEGKRLYILQ